MLASKRILLGITGGIAAYKTTFLTRLLIKAGAEVRIVKDEDLGQVTKRRGEVRHGARES